MLAALLGWMSLIWKKIKVSTADTTDNNTMADVIGNKTDASYNAAHTEKSLIAYAKGALGNQAVPSADSTANSISSYVIGNKADAAQTTVDTTRSIMSYVKGILNTVAAFTGWPGYGVGNTQLEIGAFNSNTASNWVTLAVAGSINTLAAWTQLISSLSNDGYLNALYVRCSGRVTDMSIEIGIGAASSESTIVRVPFRNYASTEYQPLFIIPIKPAIKITAGTRIAARQTCDNLSYDDVAVNIGFQEGL